MIIKERVYPPEIIQLEAAYNRLLNGTDPRKESLLSEIKIKEVGYQGEKAVDYYLRLLPNEPYLILNNLRLEVFDEAFEIDTVLLTPHYILLNDIKNFRGKLFFDQMLQQCTRFLPDLEESVSDPIAQAKRHLFQMKNFWHHHKLPSIPLIPLVCISHSNTAISTNPGFEKELHNWVIHSEQLIERLLTLNATHPSRKLTANQTHRLSTFLIQNHSPKPLNALEKYNFKPEDFSLGVPCPACFKFGMAWAHGKWTCPFCKATSKTAHYQAIYDYLLILKPTLSNSECREILGIPSPHTIKRLLLNMPLKKVGSTRGALYSLQDNWVEHYKEIRIKQPDKLSKGLAFRF